MQILSKLLYNLVAVYKLYFFIPIKEFYPLLSTAPLPESFTASICSP